MNTTPFLFKLFWNILGIVKPSSQRSMFEWGIQKHIFADETKIYENLRTELLGGDLTSPIGIASDLGVDESTIDLLIQHGAGFGTLGGYTFRENADHYRSLYYVNEKKKGVVKDDFRKKSIDTIGKKLSQRRHLPHFVGISLLSFNADDVKIGSGEEVPGYLNELELITQKVAPYADFLVIDVSQPNVPLYHLLSDESSMIPLIQNIRQTAEIAAPISTPKILLKVPYDISALEVKSISQIALKTGVDAIIVAGFATVEKHKEWIKNCGLEALSPTAFIAGKPLKSDLINLVRAFRKRTNGLIPLIASGAVLSGQDAFDLLAAGASAVEADCVFFTDGPCAIHQMNADLSRILRKKGIRRIADVIGMNTPLDPNVELRDLFD